MPDVKYNSTLAWIAFACILGGNLLAGESQDPPQTGKAAFKVLPESLVVRAVALRERALAESRAYEFLAALTTEVGPRFAGSAKDRQAVKWARSKLPVASFENYALAAPRFATSGWTSRLTTEQVTSATRKMDDEIVRDLRESENDRASRSVVDSLHSVPTTL